MKKIIWSVISMIAIVTIGIKMYSNKADAGPITKKNIDQITKQEFIDYSNTKNQMLEKMINTDGEAIIPTRISFKSYINKQELKDLAQNNGFKVKEIYLGWGENRGGYSVEKGQTLDMAISAAIEDHQKFLDTVLKIEKDPTLIKSLKDYKTAYEQQGLTIFAIDTEAKVKNLANVKRNNKVRFIDVNEDKSNSFIVPLMPTDFAN
jgi:hypothetical protein